MPNASNALGIPPGSVWLIGINTPGDTAPIQYEWNPSSGAAEDDVTYTVANPVGNTGTGRWLRVASSSDPLMAIYIPGRPTYGSAVLWTRILSAAFSLPANFAGSKASVDVAPTANAVFTIKRYILATTSWVTVGTVTFAASSGVPTFSTQAPVKFAIGDKFQIIGPASADATLQGATFDFFILR